MDLLPIGNRVLACGSTQTVNARDLHTFLGVQRRYADWMRDQIKRARLIPGRDFVEEVFHQEVIKPENQRLSGDAGPGRPRIDHHLTLDAGKHIAMMSGTERGYQVREYFLECERRAKEAELSRVRGEFGGHVTDVVKSMVAKIIAELLPGLVEERLAADPRVAVIDLVSVTQVLSNLGIPAKGRRRLRARVFRRLFEHCAVNAIRPRRCARTGTWLFPIDVAETFVREQCRDLISQHYDWLSMKAGQGVLQFPRPNSPQSSA